MKLKLDIWDIGQILGWLGLLGGGQLIIWCDNPLIRERGWVLLIFSGFAVVCFTIQYLIITTIKK